MSSPSPVTAVRTFSTVEAPASSGLYPPGLNRAAIAPNAQIPRLVFTRRPYRLAPADDTGDTARERMFTAHTRSPPRSSLGAADRRELAMSARWKGARGGDGNGRSRRRPTAHSKRTLIGQRKRHEGGQESEEVR